MRGTRAKQLRRAAQEMTVGLPAVSHEKKRTRWVDTVKLGNCTRRAYQRLKAGFRRLNQGEKHGIGQ